MRLQTHLTALRKPPFSQHQVYSESGNSDMGRTVALYWDGGQLQWAHGKG